MKYKEEMIQIASEVFELPIEDISELSSQDTIKTWDSLAHLQLIMAIENKYQISIPFNKVAEIKSINDAIILVDSLCK